MIVERYGIEASDPPLKEFFERIAGRKRVARRRRAKAAVANPPRPRRARDAGSGTAAGPRMKATSFGTKPGSVVV